MYINWLTLGLWISFLLGYWTALPLPTFIYNNNAVVVCIIFLLQSLKLGALRNKQVFKLREIIIIGLILSLTIVCMLLSNSSPGAFLTVLNFCLLWFLSDKWKWSKKQILLLYWCIFFLFLYRLFTPFVLQDGFNTNTIGTVSTFSLFIVLAGLPVIIKNKKNRVLCELVFIILSFGQLLFFRGRATFIALTFYCLLRFGIPSHWWQKKSFMYVLCYLSTLGSLIFVIVYTYIWRISDFNFIIPIWNKGIFSGREAIWYELWTLFKHHPFIGTGSNIVLTTWFELNIHNAMYSILIIHGIIVALFFYIYIINKMKWICLLYSNHPLFIPIMSGVFSVYLESFFDMDLFWGPELLIWMSLLVLFNLTMPRQEE